MLSRQTEAALCKAVLSCIIQIAAFFQLREASPPCGNVANMSRRRLLSSQSHLQHPLRRQRVRWTIVRGWNGENGHVEGLILRF